MNITNDTIVRKIDKNYSKELTNCQLFYYISIKKNKYVG